MGVRGSGRGFRRADLWLALIVAACLAIPALATAANPAFPGADPTESPRANTPDDSRFDECEGDDADGMQECASYFEEQYEAYGFRPDSAVEGPGVPTVYKPAVPPDPMDPLNLCPQLDAQGRAANIAAGDLECAMISGVRADTAWKYDTGNPDTTIAILDTGIEWQEQELRTKVALNRDELDMPLWDRGGGPLEGAACGPAAPNPGNYDADGNGAFNVLDYRCDSRVDLTDGQNTSDVGGNADTILDASDLIGQFSDDVDDDPSGGNGYVDDIAGWDFFDDDNDAFDASSCCSADGHGTDRAREAGGETNNGISSAANMETDNAGSNAGLCPECQIVPLRVWDTFVVPIDNYAMAIVYAADNGVDVAEGAVGGLGNTQFARRAFEFADAKGMALMMVSSDINSANHNYPTNYNEAVYVAGSIPDTAPNDTCQGPGSLGPVGLPDDFEPPPEFEEGCDQFLEMLNDGIGLDPIDTSLGLQPPTTSMFRNSNLTQYGGKADIVLMGSTGSANTGQAAGAAGLLSAFGDEELASPLSGNEIRQLLTMSAEDVRPENLGTIGAPFVDKAEVGWDPHFGYGRVNLAGAMARLANEPHPAAVASWPCDVGDDNCVPPEAQINAPDWFAPINVDRLTAPLPIRGRVAAPHSEDQANIAWEVEYACGQDAPDADFEDIPDTPISGTGPENGLLGTIPVETLEDLADNCNGEVVDDYGRPAGRQQDNWEGGDPYPDSSTGVPLDNTDPERHAFQIRLTVRDGEDPDNFGRYRKTLNAYRDDGNLDGWPKPISDESSDPTNATDQTTASGGEVSTRLFDVNGDNALDVILGTTSGEIQVLDAGGDPVTSFNNGNPVTTNRYALERNHQLPVALPTPRETPRVPAIGDIDGDREAEIVTTAGEHVYAWNLDGTPVPNFQGDPNDPDTVGVDRALSEPCTVPRPQPCFEPSQRLINRSNHIKRGIFGSPALADLDCDGALDIVSGSMDQHLYAWNGDGEELPGFPVKLDSPDADGAEIVTSPAIAELDGNRCGAADGAGGGPETVISTNEVIGGDPPTDFSAFFELFSAVLASGTGSNPVYAVRPGGTATAGDPDGIVNGWPIRVGVAAGDLLPMVLPGHDSAIVDQDQSARDDLAGDDEVSVSAGTSVTPGGARLVDGSGASIREYLAGTSPQGEDNGAILNLADYSSIGDILGTDTPAVVKGGLSVAGAANLLAVNQNLPFNHFEQAWSLAGPPGNPSGASIPGYPVATDDFQLLSQASIARVAGSGPDRQILVGTGMSQLHAYGAGGLDPAGWPKFTGGWMQGTPAVGDVDGDGDLDISATTREGWSFLWDTGDPDTPGDGVNACAGTNNEWWTFHHDEQSTNNYGHDGRPPGTPSEDQAPNDVGQVTVVPDGDGGAQLAWRAPGDDWLCGDLMEGDIFRVLKSDDPITGPSDGTVVSEQAAGSTANPTSPGDTASFALTPAQRGSADNFAVFYRDETGNWGRIATGDIPASPAPDGDGDGIPNATDNCPAVANTDQADADGNGIGDVCDTPPDGDGDGAPDTTDNCPTDPNPGQEDGDGDGIGDECDPIAGPNNPGGGNQTPPPACSSEKRGTGGNDRLEGTSGSDRLVGLKVNDNIKGLGGDDCLLGNKGSDRINGGDGADQIGGGNRRDRITGGAGRDVIKAGNAGDVIKAKDGEADTINCGGGADRVKADPNDRLKNCEKRGSGKRSKKGVKP